MRQYLTDFFQNYDKFEKVGKFPFLTIEHHPGKNLNHMLSNVK